MKTFIGVEEKFNTFLTSAPDGGQWSSSWSSCFTVPTGRVPVPR